MKKLILLSVIFITINFVGFDFAQAGMFDENSYVNEYISQEKLEQSNRFIEAVSAPQVVYTVLATFALLTVITTYFVIVGILFVIFFSTYK